MAANEKKMRPSAEKTRTALIDSALRLFGERGFGATSTRDIAAGAEANIASIAYHFGGKEGLRLACAEVIVAKFRKFVPLREIVSDSGGENENAVPAIEKALVAMIRFFVVRPEAQHIAEFVMREMSQPSTAIDLIYSEMMYPFHNTLCRLWGQTTRRDPDSPATRLAVFSILGQVLYFRLGRPIVCRRMGWNAIGPKEADQIIATITGNLRTLISVAKDDRYD